VRADDGGARARERANVPRFCARRFADRGGGIDRAGFEGAVP